MTVQSHQEGISMPKQTFFNLPEEKRNHILDTAINEFAGQGYKGSSISRIVAMAGIAKGSFYQYFENKDDLFCYIVTTMIADRKLLVYEQEKHRLADLSLTGFLRLVFRRQVEEFQQNPRLLKIGIDLMQITGEPIYQRIMRQYQSSVNTYFLPFIRHEVEQGEIDPKINQQLLNFMLVSLGQYMVYRYSADEMPVINSSFIDDIVDDLEYILANGVYVKEGE